MSNKRKFQEYPDEEQTDSGEKSVRHGEPDADKPTVDSLQVATLQDLPNEFLENILIKAVVAQVTDLRLVKTKWNKKVNEIIQLFKEVSSIWKSVVGSEFFEKEVCRKLGTIGEKMVQLHCLKQTALPYRASAITMLGSQIAILLSRGRDECEIGLYECDTRLEKKVVIDLGTRRAINITGCCHTSNLDILYLEPEGSCYSVLRITKDEQQLHYCTPMSDLYLPNPTITATENGDVILSRKSSNHAPVVSIFNKDHLLVKKFRMPENTSPLKQVISKPNGNLLLLSANIFCHTLITEMDVSGRCVRKYVSSLPDIRAGCQADHFGRFVLSSPEKGMEILDCELNQLAIADAKLGRIKYCIPHKLTYIQSREEIAGVFFDEELFADVLAVLRLTED